MPKPKYLPILDVKELPRLAFTVVSPYTAHYLTVLLQELQFEFSQQFGIKNHYWAEGNYLCIPYTEFNYQNQIAISDWVRKKEGALIIRLNKYYGTTHGQAILSRL
jgi:hypothetical protein